MHITVIYELNPNTDTDEVVAVMQDFDDAKKAVAALNKKSQEAGKVAYGDDWEEYARFYYAKESPIVTSDDIIAGLSD